MKKSDLHFRFISLFPICNSFSTHFMGFIYVIMSYAVTIRQIVTIIQKQPAELFCKKKVFLNFFLRAGFSPLSHRRLHRFVCQKINQKNKVFKYVEIFFEMSLIYHYTWKWLFEFIRFLICPF